MKKRFLPIIFLFSLLFLSLSGCSNSKDNKENAENNTASNTSATRTLANVITNTTTETSEENPTPPEPPINEVTKNVHEKEEPKEEELASFTTKLGGSNSPRSRNIKITCQTLNGTTIESGKTFSFCNTIGNPTEDKGYEKADSFDANGNKVQTLGGGNCQVSSTLYNAVLKVSDLKVTERHAHSREVHYVQKDKDAAVSYGSVDFKFKNNMQNSIKIYATADLNSVNIRIVKIIS